MTIHYKQSGVQYSAAQYTYQGTLIGILLVKDPCFVALRAVIRDYRIGRPRRSYVAVLRCGPRRIT